MWTAWRRKAKFTRSWKQKVFRTFGKGNDVRHHTTLTHTLRNEKWAYWSGDMVPLSQSRMSLDVVARLLTSFKPSREFVSAIADAMTAHQHAYLDAYVLHCDISAGNMLITCESKGLLTDWDLSIKLFDPNTVKRLSSARRPDRTGTWQFMSATLLQDNKNVMSSRMTEIHAFMF
ncbi:hypothetical protein PILCRDRAFT_625277 [Piloderma croceum F 1598]|uniref:Fungal-type protein kinase domain-containing protein n=1 Tax=Piloderma croceum (strain F 1598) TaxID=765440 RepID=A0A0C3FBJ4_PILCF|nr:hypothetical protein PILCRDRAFT_625277 [Piloderma croceum F 1598]